MCKEWNEQSPEAFLSSTGLERRSAIKKIGAGAVLAMSASSASTTSQATADSSTLGHTLFGSGPTRVIVLHDWSVDTHGDYGSVMQYLDPRKLTIAFADVRGYGKSISMKGQFNHQEISGDVEKLADSLGWESFSIVGHSMTGMSVQRIMADIPHRLNRVIATTPVPASGFPLDEETFAFFESMASDDTAFINGMHALTSARYSEGWGNFKLQQNRPSVASEAMKRYTAMWSKENFAAEVEGNETEILVIYGEFDNEGLRQTATGNLFKAWYPNLKEHVCPSGHYPMLETPVEYATVVQKYLAAES